jgi:hypothetical protein
MRINEFVEPKRQYHHHLDESISDDVKQLLDIVKNKGKPNFEVFQDGKVKAPNGKIYPNSQAVLNAIKTERDLAATRWANKFNTTFASKSFTAKWFGVKAEKIKNVTFKGGKFALFGTAKYITAISIAGLDLMYQAYQVGAGQRNPREIDYSAFAGVAAALGGTFATRILVVSSVKLAYRALLSTMTALKIIKGVKNASKVATVATAAAGPATGGTSWLATLGAGASWVASEVLFYLGMKTVITIYMNADKPAYEAAYSGAEGEAKVLFELEELNRVAETYLKEAEGNSQQQTNTQKQNTNNQSTNNQNTNTNNQSTNNQNTKGSGSSSPFNLGGNQSILDLNSIQFGKDELIESQLMESEDYQGVDKNPSAAGFIKYITSKHKDAKASKAIDAIDIPADAKKLAKTIYIDKDVNKAKEIKAKIDAKKEKESDKS